MIYFFINLNIFIFLDSNFYLLFNTSFVKYSIILFVTSIKNSSISFSEKVLYSNLISLILESIFSLFI